MANEVKESQSQWWARNYMEHSDGKVGETDLAIAFKAGRRAAKLNCWHWVKTETPKVTANRRVALVEFLNREDYEIHTVLTSEYALYVKQHPFCLLWAYADILVNPKTVKADLL